MPFAGASEFTHAFSGLAATTSPSENDSPAGIAESCKRYRFISPAIGRPITTTTAITVWAAESSSPIPNK